MGDGTAVISAIEISDIFSIDSALSSFTIAEGAPENIVINYAPINAGEVNASMTLHTNDPSNASIEIALNGVGISEISGEVCNTVWTPVNSPYFLVGNIHIPNGCSMIVDSAVTIDMQGFSIDIEEGGALTLQAGSELINHENSTISNQGQLTLYGSQENPIAMSTLQITGDGDIDSEYCQWEVGPTEEGGYANDFTTQNEGWSQYSPSSVYEPSNYGYYRLYYNYNGSSDWDWHFTSPVFSFDPSGFVSTLFF